ncbi:hypothetical protein [Streptomyces lanatus]|uniref:Uncharacterized protein n=1 Tax=Streptomyces lanatus TaxID=66900 RepID=A0ABV1XLV0_9ACTN|nr:hypothetical protein [Streptomyces lanatus]GHG99446.1 hypothetical protein GCM10018780_26150 [Streptomyces lanatus]
MTASPNLPHDDHHAVAALCTLLGSSGAMRHSRVREMAERARDLLRSGAGADELAAHYSALDTLVRQEVDARGLVVTQSRTERVPGIVHHIKVAECPGPLHCTRVERARDLLPAPPCAVNGTRMRKGRLGPAQ